MSKARNIAVTVIAAAIIGVGVTLLVTALGGKDLQSIGAPVTRTSAAPLPSMPEPLGSCDALAGIPTMKVVDIGLCTDERGGQRIAISASYDCTDGRKLYWNDYGWGYDNAVWQTHRRPDGQLVPPAAELTRCTR